MQSKTFSIFDSQVLGHPAGLFVLFFTEMWERFSYYGMRAILVLYLTSAIIDGGWAWPREHALALYGTYTSMVYLTPLVGGYIADRILGNRKAVVIGAFLMTLGHASLALETPLFLYIGLGFLIIGNGFFKPNMTSIISHMYKDHPEKKDGAFTIFYMGVNAGAFLGIMLCGYLGEKIGWSWGFGLAGIFMFFGMLQFYLSGAIFGDIGDKPIQPYSTSSSITNASNEKLNPFTKFDLGIMVTISIAALLWVINDPLSRVYSFNIFGSNDLSNGIILMAVLGFLYLLFSRIIRYDIITRDRMIAVFLIALFYMFFWACFEQAGGSMTIFASDYTQRGLSGNSALIFKTVNSLLTIIPLGIITYVLIMLNIQTIKRFTWAAILLSTSFIIIWGIVVWMLKNEFSNDETEITASWFGILNSFFIITFGPVFSKLWESKYNPPAHIKYGVGLFLLGLGFFSLAYGSLGIPQGAATASVSMIWLVFAYLFHTLGELCISPVGLSYVSKLVPGRMIAIMYGIWYISVAIGNKLAGTMGGMIDKISLNYDISTFFMIFSITPFLAGMIIIGLGPLLRKLMHGIR